MAVWAQLLADIQASVDENNNGENTGTRVQNILEQMTNTIGENATFKYVATPATNPGTNDGPVFYLAIEAGTYSNFGGIVLDGNEAFILGWNGTNWSSYATGIPSNTLANLNYNNNKSGIALLLKIYNPDYVFIGYADTNTVGAASKNYTYLAIESGTVLGVLGVIAGDLIVHDGTGFKVDNFDSNVDFDIDNALYFNQSKIDNSIASPELFLNVFELKNESYNTGTHEFEHNKTRLTTKILDTQQLTSFSVKPNSGYEVGIFTSTDGLTFSFTTWEDEKTGITANYVIIIFRNKTDNTLKISSSDIEIETNYPRYIPFNGQDVLLNRVINDADKGRAKPFTGFYMPFGGGAAGLIIPQENSAIVVCSISEGQIASFSGLPNLYDKLYFFTERPVWRNFGDNTYTRAAALGVAAAAGERYVATVLDSTGYTDVDIPYIDVIKTGASVSTDISVVCIGDSLTFGSGPAESGPVRPSSYPSQLATRLGAGYNVINLGYPGNGVRDIAARAGNMPYYFDVDFTLLADTTPTQIGTFGASNIKSSDDNLPISLGLFEFSITDAVGESNPCYVIENDEIVEIRINVNATASPSQSSDPITVKRTSAGVSDIQIKAGDTFYCKAAERKNADVLCIWQGTNNTLTDIELLEYTNKLIGYYDTKNIIVIGLHDLGSGFDLPTLQGYETAMQREYGLQYFNLRKYMNERGLDDAGLTPTAQDLIDIADGKCPGQLLADGLHFVAQGYTLIRNAIHRKGQILGYW